MKYHRNPRRRVGPWLTVTAAAILIASGSTASGDPGTSVPADPAAEEVAAPATSEPVAPPEVDGSDPTTDATAPAVVDPALPGDGGGGGAAEPLDSGDGVDPIAPVGPAEPAAPADPGEPGDAADPTEPTEAPVPEAGPAPVVAPAAHEDGDHGDDDEHEGGHGSAVVLVNGQPFRGQGDSKLEGCSITLSVAELEDAEHGVEGSILAIEPSGEAELVTFEEGFTGTSWSSTWELDALVEGLVQKPNGYRIQIVLAIDDGGPVKSRPLWLACGAPQTGSPFVIVIDKQWLDAAGDPLPGPPADLPEDWQITASSQLGSARCLYPDGSAELVCEYENRGSHEGEDDGLRVPGGKRKTFTVEESPLPDGWSNVAGIGTFEPRKVCPGGHGGGHDDGGHDDGGHDDGGHDDGGHTSAEPGGEEGEGGREPCAHLVVNQQDPQPTTTTTPTTAVPATTAPGGDVEDAGADRAPVSAGTLARTGSSTGPLTIVGVAALVLGTVLMGARRRLSGRA